MKIKHVDLEISAEDPFKNCKLNRKMYAEALTTVIETYSTGFVLAVNNPWGTGKTTFVKMWQAYLKGRGFETLYFNAWENDFENNPLVPILSELKSISGSRDGSTFKSLIQKGALITQNILPGIGKAIIEKYIDTAVLSEAVEGAIKSTTDILKDEIDEFAKKKKGLIEFREELEKYLTENEPDKPVVFIIDELDRCKPNYSVEVLEQIKHFFNVPGIVFVLTIDKAQLGHAIKGAYNSEFLNTTEYLRRFIDLEYSLPIPSYEEFSTYLYEYFDFKNFFKNPERIKHHVFVEDGSSFLNFSTSLFKGINASLRQQEKLFSNARVILYGFNTYNFVFPTLFIFLLYLKEFYNDLYQELILRKIQPTALPKKLDKTYPNIVGEDNLRSFQYTEALLLHLYFNYYKELDRTMKLYESDRTTDKVNSFVKSGLDSDDADSTLVESLVYFSRQDFRSTSLKFIIDRIDLLAVSK